MDVYGRIGIHYDARTDNMVILVIWLCVHFVFLHGFEYEDVFVSYVLLLFCCMKIF